MLLLGAAAMLAAGVSPARAGSSKLAHMELSAFVPFNSVHYSGTCDPSGTSVISFTAVGQVRNASSGSTTDVSYPGSFALSGSVTIGPQDQSPGFMVNSNYNGGPVGAVEAFSESFTIHAAGGVTITGSDQLDNSIHPTDTFTDPPAGWFSWGQCVDRTTSYGTQALGFGVSSDYQATIQSSDGSSTNDSGVSFSFSWPSYNSGGTVVALSFGQYLASGYSGPLDTTPPTAAPTQAPPPNADGWNTSDVTVNWNWTDTGGSGIDASRCPASSTSSGSGVIQLSATCRDVAGNVGTATYTVKVVKTTITIGPQAMEGNLVVSPGAILQAGFDFTMPGSHADATENFVNGSVIFQATCVGESGGGTILVPIADVSYEDPAGSSSWYPGGSPYQGSTTVPDLCGGGQMSLSQGGTFTAGIWSTDTTDKVNVRWHYSADGSAGGWSGTKSVTPL